MLYTIMFRYPSIFSLLLLTVLANAQDQHDGVIVGGSETERGRYNYMVALITNGYQYCGGSLIAPGYVLSAAHCAGRCPTVMIGRHDLYNSSETYETINVEYEVLHPEYVGFGSYGNDIMVLKLETNSSYIPVMYDDGSSDTSAGEDVTVMGWGTTQSGGSPSNILLEVEVDIVSNTDCDVEYDGDITDDMLCAARSGKDSCEGDSGGPLIIAGSNATSDVQVGIVSWGRGCAKPGYSGVYSRVSSNVEFIECVINGGSDECGKVCKSDEEKLMLKFLKNIIITRVKVEG